jgi:hypothetical protein
MNLDPNSNGPLSPPPDARGVPAIDADQCEARIARFSASSIAHPVWKQCLSTIRAMHVAGRHNRSKPRGLLITGPTGTGKSTIAKEYESRYPRREVEDRTVIPVLRVELPGQPSAKVIGEHFLLTMGDPMAQCGSAEFRLARVRRLLAECRTECVIVDEFQHLTDNLDSRTRDIAADTVKNLMNETGLPFVFIGGPSCRSYFVKNQQLGRRCTPKVELQPFGYGTTEEQRDFHRLLKALHQRLPLEGPSALVDASSVLPLFLASFGLLGHLTQLIEAALRLVLYEGAVQLDREVLKRAFGETIYQRCPPARNPFDLRFNGKPLDRPNEPFHGLLC